MVTGVHEEVDGGNLAASNEGDEWVTDSMNVGSINSLPSAAPMNLSTEGINFLPLINKLAECILISFNTFRAQSKARYCAEYICAVKKAPALTVGPYCRHWGVAMATLPTPTLEGAPIAGEW